MLREGRKNPTITDLSFKDDIILVRSSQEVFGRPPKVKKKSSETGSPLRKNDELSRSSPISPYCSLENGMGKEMRDIVGRYIPGEPRKAKFGKDLADTYHVKRSLADKMKELNHMKQELELSNTSPPLLVTVLRMPNVQRTLRLITTIIRRERLARTMKIWQHFISTKMAVLQLALTRENRAVVAVQRVWRVSRARAELYRRRDMRLREERRRSSAAVATIESSYKKHVAAKKLKASAEEDLNYQRTASAKTLQRMFRGWRGRAWRVNSLRVLLLKDLRSWADGSIQKLVDRPGKC